jgi:hypothetical protein
MAQLTHMKSNCSTMELGGLASVGQKIEPAAEEEKIDAISSTVTSPLLDPTPKTSNATYAKREANPLDPLARQIRQRGKE